MLRRDEVQEVLVGDGQVVDRALARGAWRGCPRSSAICDGSDVGRAIHLRVRDPAKDGWGHPGTLGRRGVRQLSPTGHPDRQPRPSPPDLDAVEPREPPVVRDALAREEPPDELDGLVRAGAPLRLAHPYGLELPLVPSRANAEDEPIARERLQRREPLARSTGCRVGMTRIEVPSRTRVVTADA